MAYLAAVARKVREDGKQDLAGWSVTDLLGWVVLYHPGLGKEMENFADRIADVPIPYKETERR